MRTSSHDNVTKCHMCHAASQKKRPKKSSPPAEVPPAPEVPVAPPEVAEVPPEVPPEHPRWPSGASRTPTDAPNFTRGLAVALDGKTPKKLGLAPRVRSENPKARRKRAGCALKMPFGARDRDVRSTSPRAAEFEFYFRGCRQPPTHQRQKATSGDSERPRSSNISSAAG